MSQKIIHLAIALIAIHYVLLFIYKITTINNKCIKQTIKITGIIVPLIILYLIIKFIIKLLIKSQ
jgi:hypothetical protein